MAGKTDKAGTRHWDQVWQNRAIPAPFDPNAPALDEHLFRHWHKFFRAVLPLAREDGSSVLVEAGCGGSRWLPYFQRQLNYRVLGLDYSEPGCELARAILQKANVPGEVVQTDLLNLPDAYKSCADVVFSGGLVEHFQPTEAILAPLAQMARPGGMVVTSVPNFRGLPGLVQRLLDKTVYDKHVPLSRADLARAHEAVGLRVVTTGCLATINFSVVNIERYSGSWAYPVLARLLAWSSKWYWLLERAGLPAIPNPLTSPFLTCVSVKPD